MTARDRATQTTQVARSARRRHNIIRDPATIDTDCKVAARRLTDDDVIIRERVAAGESVVAEAADFGICRRHANNIVHGRRTSKVGKPIKTRRELLPRDPEHIGPLSDDISELCPQRIWAIYTDFICGHNNSRIARVRGLTSSLMGRLARGWESGILVHPAKPLDLGERKHAAALGVLSPKSRELVD